MRSTKSEVSPVHSLDPQARTANEDGAGADLRGFESALALIHAGDWTDGTHTFEVQESEDDVTYTAVTDADLDGTEPVLDAAADGNQVYRLGYLGSKRFLRVVVTVAGATIGAESAATILRGQPQYAPVA